MVARHPASDHLLGALRARWLASARELGSTLGASQPSISRWLAGAGDQIVRVGRARSSRYAAVRNVRGLGHRWPLYRIDGNGQLHAFARMTALHGGGCLITTENPPDWLRDEFSEGVFSGLPWLLDGALPLPLAPSYDMLPMLYRPAANGSTVPREYQPPTPLPTSLAYWQQAATRAGTFWQRVVAHPEVSADFRRIAEDNQAQLTALRHRFGANGATA